MKLINKMFLQNNKIFLGIVFITVFFQACFSVRYSTTGASISPEIKTFTVKTFLLRTPNARPNMAQQFTDALKDKIQQNTKLILTNNGGDVQFEGEITGYQVTPQAIQSNDRAAKNRLTVTVHVKFINLVEPKYNYDATFSRYQDFSTSQQLYDVENQLVKTIFDELTEEIFNKSFSNW